MLVIHFIHINAAKLQKRLPLLLSLNIGAKSNDMGVGKIRLIRTCLQSQISALLAVVWVFMISLFILLILPAIFQDLI